MMSIALGGPWFRRHPVAAAVVASLLVVGITWLRFAHRDETDATTLLYVLPVTLVAMTFGSRAGTVVAVTCTALLSSWAVIADADLTVLGWTTRVIPLLLLGVLIGRATDAMDAAAEAEVELAIATARQRDAVEVQDEIIQRLAAAKWQVEALGGERAAELLEDAIVAGQMLVGSLMAGNHDRPARARGNGRAPARHRPSRTA